MSGASSKENARLSCAHLEHVQRISNCNLGWCKQASLVRSCVAARSSVYLGNLRRLSCDAPPGELNRDLWPTRHTEGQSLHLASREFSDFIRNRTAVLNAR